MKNCNAGAVKKNKNKYNASISQSNNFGVRSHKRFKPSTLGSVVAHNLSLQNTECHYFNHVTWRPLQWPNAQLSMAARQKISMVPSPHGHKCISIASAWKYCLRPLTLVIFPNCGKIIFSNDCNNICNNNYNNNSQYVSYVRNVREKDADHE